MGMLQEFKEFAVRGNAVDMAVGVVIGAAFGKIVTALVEDLMMPPFGMLLGGSDFSNLFFTLDGSDFATLAAAKAAGAPVVGYGSFLQTTINFLIIAFAVFLMVKVMNKVAAATASAEAEQDPPEPSEDVLLLREIRDSLTTSVGKLSDTHTAIEAVVAKLPEPGTVVAVAASADGAAAQATPAAGDGEAAAEAGDAASGESASAGESSDGGAETAEPAKPKPAIDDLGWIDD